jgi:hypothetical protein
VEERYPPRLSDAVATISRVGGGSRPQKHNQVSAHRSSPGALKGCRRILEDARISGGDADSITVADAFDRATNRSRRRRWPRYRAASR